MVTASQVKAGQFLKLDNGTVKVIDAVTRTGGGKSGSMVHMKLKDVATGHVQERRFAPTDKLEDLEITRTKMQFLFREGDAFTFMNPETYDQVPIRKSAIGPAAAYLKESDEILVEFHEEEALSIDFPPAVELAVTSTGAGVKGQTKEAALENGLTVLVPEFVKEGDRVRVDVETGKYLARVKDRERKGAKFTTPAPEVKGEPKKKPEPDK